MSNFHEIEFKNLLTESEYNLLLKNFNKTNKEIKKQTNIYFDTADLYLKKHNYALRARVLENNIELTLKQPQEIGILETTDFISHKELDFILNNQTIVEGYVNNILEPLLTNINIIPIAELTTYRFETEYLDNLLVLDKSIYYNTLDYEIELETKDFSYGKEVFEKLLKEFNIPKRITKNKITRAYEYKIKGTQ